MTNSLQSGRTVAFLMLVKGRGAAWVEAAVKAGVTGRVVAEAGEEAV